MDKNDNRICDRDEVTPTALTSTTTTSLTISTTAAVDNVPPARGELINLELSPSSVYPGEAVTVRATFRNLGSSSIPLVLRCNVVSSDNEVIGVIYGGETGVPAGQDGQVTASFTPAKPGRYVIRGRVYYLDKMSSELSTTLEVKAP